MKVRMDFVTNSSSSSFIICSEKELSIPEEYKNIFVRITKGTDIIDAIDVNYELYDPFRPLSEEYIQTRYQFTDEQLNFVKASLLHESALYDKILSLLASGKHLYSLNTDRDWLYMHDSLNAMIHSCDIIWYEN